MENINVEAILQQIRNDIKERDLKDDDVLFESIPVLNGGTAGVYSEEAYEAVLREIDATGNVESYKKLFGNPIERFIKKIIRRMVAFYIESIVDDQNVFNKNVYTGMAMSHKKVIEDNERMLQLERKLYEYNKRILELEKKLSEKDK